MINFKDRIKRGVPEQTAQNSQWPQESNLNRVNSKKDLYKQVTNQLSSQQFEPGDFRRNEPAGFPVAKKRNSILEVECQEDMPAQNQQYYGGGQRSMLNSNVAQNFNGSLFESKLHETKGELCEQMSELEKRMKREIERDRGLIEDYLNRLFGKYTQKSREEQKKNFDSIVTQLNKNLSITSKKQKSLETGLTENQEKLLALTKHFNEFTVETEEKIEKMINANSEVGNSMKKSLSRNMGNGDYLVELKSSIKDIPVLNTALVDEIRSEIHEVQESIKALRFEVGCIKEDVKNKSMVAAEVQKTKPQSVDVGRLNCLAEEISSIKASIQALETQEDSKNKFKQLHSILEVQEENYIGINEAFQKAVNSNIIPRIKKVEEQVQAQSLERNAECLKKQVIKELESMPIIRVKPTSEEEREKMERMKGVAKGQQLIYMLDDSNHILDCFGNYLLDENNQRIKLQEDQIYYLEQVEGVQIRMPIDAR